MKRSWLILMALLAAVHASATEIVGDAEENARVATEPTVHEGQDIEPESVEEQARRFHIVGIDVESGSRRTLQWSSPQSPGGFDVATPLIVVNGQQAGPIICLTAAIHGDELNGIEIARQIVYGLNPIELTGTVVGVPIVNLEGLWRRDRYIGDRRDLNRYFPGSRDGAYPGRVAFALFDDIIRHCDAVVDLHTGSFYRENLPQLRADLTVEEVARLSRGFGGLTVLQSIPPTGSLRGAATAAGIPTVVMEIGGPLTLEPEKVELGVKSVRTLMYSMGMIENTGSWSDPQPVYYGSDWVRSDAGGILINAVRLGDKVMAGDSLAKIIDPVSNNTHKVVAPFAGTILGRAQNQFVSPGFALFRVGNERTLEELEREGAAEKKATIECNCEQPGSDVEMSTGNR